MDDAATEEKKHFDAENPEDDDSQPDPDEQLMLDQGNGRVWLVKIPKSLMERWSAVNDEDVHLATIRVYNEAIGQNGKSPRIVLFLPPAPDSIPNPKRPLFDTKPINGDSRKYAPETSTNEPDCYELDMINDSVENQMVVAERPKDAAFSLSGKSSNLTNSRARTTILTGRVKHECSLRPGYNESYRKQMRERHKKYNTPVRQIKMIEDNLARGGINRLTSGVTLGQSAFSDLVKTKSKSKGKGAERMARMPRNQLLDLIFQLFRDTPRWNIRDLRTKTQQPTAFLKETLLEVAHLHKSGEYTGHYELKDIYQEEGIKAENIPIPVGNNLKMEEEDDEDDDEDEDDDMEEVS
ncbi:transcription initiation factor IIF, beta subunit [Armillaria luteobubalina]|uniref:Transcription initiation factor IIF subunit beta n=1 Tax=Armillaria luteobubalina TaxID=153913 RepID=A0AA39QEG4_9AGAR|nr:transcription initiation factor IIF, beta subunit [Armillaria luteobubalina]